VTTTGAVSGDIAVDFSVPSMSSIARFCRETRWPRTLRLVPSMRGPHRSGRSRLGLIRSRRCAGSFVAINARAWRLRTGHQSSSTVMTFGVFDSGLWSSTVT